MGDYGIIGWGNYGNSNQVNVLRLSPIAALLVGQRPERCRCALYALRALAGAVLAYQACWRVKVGHGSAWRKCAVLCRSTVRYVFCVVLLLAEV
jgi:hypothetical protein